jgi:hypothetical protein
MTTSKVLAAAAVREVEDSVTACHRRSPRAVALTQRFDVLVNECAC